MSTRKIIWNVIGITVMLGLLLMPPLPGLSQVGQHVLAILALAVVMWVTEAVSYTFSALVIIALLILLLGYAPANGNIGEPLGTVKAIPLALSGFINSGWVLVAAGLFIAACILTTGLEKRIALNILKVVGTKTNRIFAGMIIVMLILTFIIPAMTARSATMTPIAMGLITAFNVDKRSVFARNLLVCIAIVSSISGIGVLSGGAPNSVASSFITKMLNHHISWGEWFIYGEPFSIALAIVLYFLITRMNKFEFDEVPGGKDTLIKILIEMGPMSKKEKKVSIILILTMIAWATESLHKVDANTVSILSVVLMLAPYIGVAEWKDVVNRVDWGTILLFGAGISLGENLLNSGAATWLAQSSLGALGVGNMPPLTMMLVITFAILLIRFAFASTTSSTAALVPTVLGFLVSLNNPSLPMWGMTIIATYGIYFSFILPVHSPQAMIPYSTDTFETKDMARIGIPLTIIGIAIYIVFLFTYWHWVRMI